MAEQTPKTITAFDSRFTTNRIQMFKILLTRLAPRQQNSFAVYIKLMELQYTITLLHRHPNTQPSGDDKDSSSDTIELLDELLPFSGPDERSKIENMKNMMLNMKKMQEMMEMIQMMQEMFPEGAGGDNPMDFFTAMSGMSGIPGMGDLPDMDMSAIFNMFGNDNNEQNE